MRIALDMKGQKELSKSLAAASLLLSQQNLKKMFHSIGTDIDSDKTENINKRRQFDGSPMPMLKPSTIERKKRLGKTDFLKITGGLQKTTIQAKSDEVIVTSHGYKKGTNYAGILNEREKNPAFGFMGFGKRLLDKIHKTIKHYVFDKMFE